MSGKLKNRDSKIARKDKTFVKIICRALYYCGMGDCWYEPMAQHRVPRKIYLFWCIVSNVYIGSVVFSEVLSNLRTDLDPKERNDSIQLSIAHSTICGKFFFLLINKEKIKEFLKMMLEDTRVSLSLQLDSKYVKTSKAYLAVLIGTMYGCILLTTIDGVLYHFKEGIPIRTLVTYWPSRFDSGIVVNITRGLIQVLWWYIVTVMLALDCLCVSSLVMLSFKFKALQMYFKSLRTDFIKNIDGKLKRELEQDYKNAFVAGIKLHGKTLRCTRSIQNALGNIYSLQVIQSIALLAICLIKLVRTERSLTFLLANLAFIICMLVLTGCYMLAAGNITYEASLVPTAMFHSGWELCQARAKLRPLVVVAIRCSQDQVVMTAFGVYDLSYSNFISVLRTSYSFFAVMY